MAEHSDEMARCLATCDVDGVRRLWKYVAPHLPQPASDREALTTIHYARTLNHAMSFRLRAYSHAWLLDNNHPSGLPDELKPKAQRLYPRIVEAVGVACHGNGELMRSVAPLLQRAQLDAVEDCYANGDTETETVKAQMTAAKRKTIRQLLAR